MKRKIEVLIYVPHFLRVACFVLRLLNSVHIFSFFLMYVCASLKLRVSKFLYVFLRIFFFFLFVELKSCCYVKLKLRLSSIPWILVFWMLLSAVVVLFCCCHKMMLIACFLERSYHCLFFISSIYNFPSIISCGSVYSSYIYMSTIAYYLVGNKRCLYLIFMLCIESWCCFENSWSIDWLSENSSKK